MTATPPATAASAMAVRVAAPLNASKPPTAPLLLALVLEEEELEPVPVAAPTVFPTVELGAAGTVVPVKAAAAHDEAAATAAVSVAGPEETAVALPENEHAAAWRLES